MHIGVIQLSAKPRHSHAVCTVRVHPPTSPGWTLSGHAEPISKKLREVTSRSWKSHDEYMHHGLTILKLRMRLWPHLPSTHTHTHTFANVHTCTLYTYNHVHNYCNTHMHTYHRAWSQLTWQRWWTTVPSQRWRRWCRPTGHFWHQA